MRLRDRADLLVVQAPPRLIGLAASSVARRLGIAKPIDLDIDGSILEYVDRLTPSGCLARAAEELCREVADPWLLHHCYRTFAFALLLGSRQSVDAEKLFAMAMLHDIGLTTAYEQGADPGFSSGYQRSDAECFAVRGAGVAESLAARCDYPAGRDVAEGICMHVNVRVTRRQGLEAHLVSAATALDVGGLRYKDLSRAAIESVTRRWPRGDTFADNVWRAWGCEAGRHPKCRGQFLNKWARLQRRIGKTPFPS